MLLILSRLWTYMKTLEVVSIASIQYLPPLDALFSLDAPCPMSHCFLLFAGVNRITTSSLPYSIPPHTHHMFDKMSNMSDSIGWDEHEANKT
jgi:hypothetical protein